MNSNLYGVLGVAQDASPDEIRTRYRELARRLHPDAAPDDAAAEARFKEVGQAYEVLSDSKRRGLYDEFGEVSLHPSFDAEAARQSQRGSGMGRMGGGGAQFNGMDDLLSQFFGGRHAQRPPARGSDLESRIEIDFDTSMQGGSRSITLRRTNAGDEERLRVEIPVGIASGTRLRLSGKGAPGPAGPGDLYVVVAVGPHRVFQRDGQNLLLDLPVHYREAALGASVSIPTLDARATLRIPPGSRDGSRLRLAGKGVPTSRGKEAGNLLVTLRVRIPTGPDDAERDAIAALEPFEDLTLRDSLFA